MSPPPPHIPLLWLHKEGNWYLLGQEHGAEPWPHNSVIWHQCMDLDRPSRYNGCWRLSVTSLQLSCGVCGEKCPDELAGLWKLHNWDTMDDWWIGSGDFYLHGTTKSP